MAELTRLGLSPELQVTTAVESKFMAAGTVENIVARLRGTSGEANALALVSHYDSVAAGPGAADDGAGVASMLETLRALKAGPPLRNDVIVLITDAEEAGLLGAAAFMAEHPWAKDLRLAINFEARGNAGPSQLFETSVENSDLINEFAAAAPHPAGTSLAYDVYKYLPNDTDMTVFKRYGVAGLNFAVADRWETYHTPVDNPAEVNRGSLQHHGEYALSLTRRFGNRDLAHLGGGSQVYFSLPVGGFIHYSSSRALAFALAVGVLFLLVLVWLFRAGVCRLLPYLGGLLAAMVGIILAIAAAYAFVRFVNWLHLGLLPDGDVVRSGPYWLALVTIVVAIWLAFYNLVRRKIAPENFSLAALTLWMALAVVTGLYLRGASFLFLWPGAAAIPGLAVSRKAWKQDGSPWFWAVLACLFAVPVLWEVPPMVNGLFIMLGLTTTGAVVAALVVALGLGILVPQLELVMQCRRWVLPVLALVAGLVAFGYGADTVRYGPASPKPSNQVYALDADRSAATWANSARRLDSWAMQYVGASPQQGPLPAFFPTSISGTFWQHAAPVVPLAAPEVTVVQSFADSDSRTLLLRIVSPRHAPVLLIDATKADVIDASVNGRPIGKPVIAAWNPEAKWALTYSNVPETGIEFKLRVKGGGPVRLAVQDRSFGLPEIPGQTFAARPPAMVPVGGGDVTLVRRAFVF
jgi:hypothetical protein